MVPSTLIPLMFSRNSGPDLAAPYSEAAKPSAKERAASQFHIGQYLALNPPAGIILSIMLAPGGKVFEAQRQRM